MAKKLSLPRILLHAEGAVVFLISLFFFKFIEGNWLLFIVLLFVPDIFMLGYLANAKIGSIIYNAGHLYIIPLMLIVLSVLYESSIFLQIGIIWAAHIGLDRAFGYGLKYEANFRDAHFKRL